MSPSVSFIVTVAVVAGFSIALSESASCFPKFKNAEKLQIVGNTCAKVMTAQGINLTAIPAPADLEKNHWDDKCMANCTMVELKVISNNTFKKEALLTLLKETAPQELLSKLTTIVDECEAISFKHELDHSKGDGKNNSNDDKKGKAASKNKSGSGRAKAGKQIPNTNNSTATPSNRPTKENKLSDSKSSHIHKICKEAAKFFHCFQEKGQQAC